jgi:hypothetical protein
MPAPSCCLGRTIALVLAYAAILLAAFVIVILLSIIPACSFPTAYLVLQTGDISNTYNTSNITVVPALI